MEVQVQDLLNTIKKEGVENARKEADEIIAKAKAEADSIIATARKEADQYKERAQAEARQFEASAKSAVSQAGRDILITVQKALQSSFDRIVEEAIAEKFSGDKLADAVSTVVKSFKITGEIEIPQKEMTVLETQLKAKLGEQFKSGLELKVGKGLSGGFILKEQDGKAYYDFSEESIAEVIKTYLSQSISELIRVQQ